jgi:hypothetical protein
MLLREVLAPKQMVMEGGNEFKSAAKVPMTKQNANEVEVGDAIKELGAELKLPLEKFKTGSIIYPHAETGDGDTVLDPADYIKVDPSLAPKAVQDQFRNWLAARLQKAGYKELAKNATIDQPGRYYKIAGDGLTDCVQIPKSKEWIQIDLDIAEPGQGEFSRWSKRGEPNAKGTPKDERAKGAFRHILKSGIARALNPNWKWSFKNGLVDDSTGEQIKDADAVAKKFFGDSGKASDLDNITTILKKLKETHPEIYQDVVNKVNDGIANMKYNYRLK